MDIEVGPCTQGEQLEAFRAAQTAFTESANQKEIERWGKVVAPERTFAAREGGVPVGTGANISFEMKVPGGDVPAAGVTMIGVLPTHRRQGVLTKMMTALHADALARSEPVAILWASEAVIYQRFGYGLAIRNYRMDAERNIRFRSAESLGTTRLVDADAALKVFPAVYDRVRAETPGMLSRDENWWREHRLADPEHYREGRSELFFAVLEVDGNARAYASYRGKHIWDPAPRGRIDVSEALGTDPVATRAIWQFLFGIDLMDKISYNWLPLGHQLIHDVLEPIRLGLKLDDALWLRILDVRKAMRARSYSAADRVVFRLQDPGMPSNEGVWSLDTTGENAEIERSDEPPQLEMSVNDLAAVYLGDTSLAELKGALRVREILDGATRRMDTMLRTDVGPWCPEVF